MTQALFRVICKDALGARNFDRPELGLEQDTLYEVVADVKDAKTARVPQGGSSGYVLRNPDTGIVLAQIFRRDRFVREDQQSHSDTPTSTVDPLGVGDQVVCVDAVGARSHSAPETMLEQDEVYEIVADVDDAVTARKPEGGASGFMVKRAEDDAYLAGVWRRSRFARA